MQTAAPLTNVSDYHLVIFFAAPMARREFLAFDSCPIVPFNPRGLAGGLMENKQNLQSFKEILKKLGFVAAATLFLVQCTKNNSATSTVATTPNAVKPVRIGFVLATVNEERYAKDRNYFMDAAKAAGAEVEFASCDDKVALQTAKVETLLSKKIDVLVIQPVNGEAAGSIVSMAKKDNVPVVAYDRIIKNADIDLYVTQDSFKVGALQAEAAVAATGQKGNYVILMGEAGHSVADEITRVNLSVLSKYPNVKIVLKQNHPGWSTAAALSTVENALTKQHNDIQAILANNDGMALGATQALGEQKLNGKVFVAGADADLTAVQNILQGKQSLTILKGIKPLAEAAVASAVKIARKEKPASDTTINNGLKDIPVVSTPVVAINKDNVQKEIVESGFHPASAVFGTTGTPVKSGT
jgi:D-xylose transport system substrate-binding protein